MPALSHQIITHPEFAQAHTGERHFTPFVKGRSFSWFLLPVQLASEASFLLVNTEFGYCELVVTLDELLADIEDSALWAIEACLPDVKDDYNISVSANPKHITWHTSTKMPEHVAQQFLQASKRLKKCKDISAAEAAMDRLNQVPVTIGGRTFKPAQGLEGLLWELAEKVEQYALHTPKPRQFLDKLMGKMPWLG